MCIILYSRPVHECSFGEVSAVDDRHGREANGLVRSTLKPAGPAGKPEHRPRVCEHLAVSRFRTRRSSTRRTSGLDARPVRAADGARVPHSRRSRATPVNSLAPRCLIPSSSEVNSAPHLSLKCRWSRFGASFRRNLCAAELLSRRRCSVERGSAIESPRPLGESFGWLRPLSIDAIGPGCREAQGEVRRRNASPLITRARADCDRLFLRETAVKRVFTGCMLYFTL